MSLSDVHLQNVHGGEMKQTGRKVCTTYDSYSADAGGFGVGGYPHTTRHSRERKVDAPVFTLVASETMYPLDRRSNDLRSISFSLACLHWPDKEDHQMLKCFEERL